MKLTGRFSFIGVVLLAAGRSERMGRPKLLLPWGATSLIGHLIEQWSGLGVGQIRVVCAADDAGIQRELDRISFARNERIFNSSPERGMFSSIQCAAASKGWPPAVTHVAVALGDQPHLRRETLASVLEFSAARPGAICQPRFAGHRRHPVVLPAEVFAELASARVLSLKEFLESLSGRTEFCEVNDAGLALDIDRPEDYQEALRQFSNG